MYPVCGAVALKTANAYGFLSAPWETLPNAHLEELPAHCAALCQQARRALGQKPKTARLLRLLAGPRGEPALTDEMVSKH